VRAAAAAYLAALTGGDAAVIADFWTDDGVLIDASGVSHPARELAQQEPAAPPPGALPAAPPPPITSIHFVSATVAIEQSRAAEKAANVPQAPAGDQFVAVWVKQGDRWRLSLVRELPAPALDEGPAQTPAPLAELDWLVGSWTATRDGAVVDMTVEWTADRAYLLQRFTAMREGREVRRGTQRIAWDAAANQVRSWTFSTDGGFSEAAWRKEGDVWVATSAGVLPDGRRQKSVQFWTPEGVDALWFKSLRAEVDGQAVDDLVLHFTRRRAARP
jgi:ketosteroid isomerase-like protein